MGNFVSFVKKKLNIEYEYSVITNPKIKIVCKCNCKYCNQYQYKGKLNKSIHYISYENN